MLSIYLGGVLFGGVLLAASVFGGHHGGGHDAGHDPGHDGPGPHAEHDRGHSGWRLPFLSLRFWAFATAFFGLTGFGLTLVGAAGALTPVLAGAMGIASGLVSAKVLGGLGRQSLGLIGDAQSHLGREGQVLLPVGPGQRGKIRLSIGGVSTDLVAETDATARLEAGATALVVGLRGNVALVETSPGTLPGQAPRPLLQPTSTPDAAADVKQEKS
jgi:hypothetical protein